MFIIYVYVLFMFIIYEIRLKYFRFERSRYVFHLDILYATEIIITDVEHLDPWSAIRFTRVEFPDRIIS